VDEFRGRGLKRTPQRALILKVLEETEEHLTAEEIARRVKEKSVDLSLSTVYRTLDVLVAMGLVQATRTGRNVVYEKTVPGTGHQHLVCVECGATIDVTLGSLDSDVLEKAKEHSFSLESIELIGRGLCKQCQLKKAGTSAV
jgi:Fe2+ or Zn2+ uptake regulation protein